MGSLINQAIENNIDDFKILKKHYGERFAKLCRTLFPTILEEKGALFNLILSKFAPSKFLYEDIVNNYASERFKNFIYGLYIKESEEHHDIEETPEQLFDKAGYTLYKCKTDADVHKFEKYYANGERLCTFTDSDRIKTHTIFFAVKKNVDEIKRENFSKPRRQDEYGTSVISLQFTKGKHSTLSIKNRYNHKVDNPDATFSNDLENIYPGLTDSFQKYYDINLVAGKHNFELPGYVMAKDGKYYRYNHEIDNVYYCSNNIIITNSEPQYLDSRRYDLIEYFIIDKQEKTLTQAPKMSFEDGFVNAFNDSNSKDTKIKKIEISKQNEEKTFVYTLQDNNIISVVVDKYNQIVEYHNPNIEIIPERFLYKNTELREFDVPKVYKISDHALKFNDSMEDLILPRVRIIGWDFMEYNSRLKTLSCPQLMQLGLSSFKYNNQMKSLTFDNLEEMGRSCFLENRNIVEFIAPKLKNMGDYCFQQAKNLSNINILNLETMGLKCFEFNKKLTKLYLPKLKTMRSLCFSENQIIDELNLSSLVSMGRYCFGSNDNITTLNLPALHLMDGYCFCYNEKIEQVNAPNLEYLGNDCFKQAINLKEFNTSLIRIPRYIYSALQKNNKNQNNLQS